MAIHVEEVKEYKGGDLEDLCQITEDAIRDGIGFNWLTPPSRDVLETYWRGVLMVPERTLFVGRLDNVLAGSVQLIRPSKNKETSAFCAHIEGHFVAPWARGHGIAKALMELAEKKAATMGFSSLRLDVRESQSKAITLYRENHYIEWGVLPNYEYVGGAMVRGHFFYKSLKPLSELI